MINIIIEADSYHIQRLQTRVPSEKITNEITVHISITIDFDVPYRKTRGSIFIRGMF